MPVSVNNVENMLLKTAGSTLRGLVNDKTFRSKASSGSATTYCNNCNRWLFSSEVSSNSLGDPECSYCRSTDLSKDI